MSAKRIVEPPPHLSPRGARSASQQPPAARGAIMQRIQPPPSSTGAIQSTSVLRQRTRTVLSPPTTSTGVDQKPRRNYGREQQEARQEAAMLRGSGGGTQNGRLRGGNGFNADDCVICHSSLKSASPETDASSTTTTKTTVKTNYSQLVDCACPRATLHYECLERWLRTQRDSGKRQLKCPVCTRVCAKLVDRWNGVLTLLSTVCLYLGMVNIFAKLLLHWSIELLGILYSSLTLYASYRHTRGRLRYKHFRKLILTVAFVLLNRVLITAVNHSATFAMQSCNVFRADRDVYARSYAHLSATARADVHAWASVHHSFVGDWAHYAAPRASNPLYCGLILLGYHLLFEYQLKFYMYLVLRCLLVFNEMVMRRDRIKVKHR